MSLEATPFVGLRAAPTCQNFGATLCISPRVRVVSNLTPCRRPNFDPLRLSLGLRAERRRELLAVEDCAEIRRLHRAEGLPIKLIARTLKVSRNTGRRSVGPRRATASRAHAPRDTAH